MQRELAINLLKTFKENNQQKYGIEALGLFGSTARDEAKLTSDIDVCIKTQKANLFELVHIKQELEELLSTPIDIIRLRDKMNPFLKNRIEKEAIYV